MQEFSVQWLKLYELCKSLDYHEKIHALSMIVVVFDVM